MAKKKFTSKFFKDLFYEVMDEYWLDDDTYVIIFQDMVDSDGDTFHLEVEYHKDENRITYTRVYEYENVEATIAYIFKKQIEEYTLQQVGVLRKGSFLNNQNVSLELKLDVPKDTTIGELNEWLTTLKFEVVHTMTPRDEKIKLLSVKNKI
jgi:hypothetical protein